VNLTDQGRAEAREAGKLLKEEGLEFDATFTSLLKRAISTQNIALEEMDRQWYPVTRTWRLNERHYGALQGLNKTETVQKYGEEQVLEWRRSYAIPPPSVEEASDHYPGNDIRYADIPKDEIPLAESLATTGVRLMPEWEGNIQPLLKDGKTVLITAHGNSLRALVKILDGISEEEILGVNIPTGVPLLYQLDDDLNPVPQEGAASPLSGRYLGNPEEIAARAQAVANQTSA
jgi:2,3-bisphosphoglycerate-dependent phosphoglycerate mutase